MKTILLLPLFLVSCVLPRPAQIAVWEKTMKPMTMCTLPFKVFITPDVEEKWHPVVENSAEYWNKALGFQVFDYKGMNENSWTWKNPSTVLLIDTGSIGQLNKYGDNMAAVAKRRVRKNDGCLISSSILVKQTIIVDWLEFESWDRFETLMRHEMGHVVGLSHSQRIGDLMYYQIIRGSRHPLDAHPEAIELLKKIYSVTK